MKAMIEVDVPEFQIGQEASVYFKDTMCVKGVCRALPGDRPGAGAITDSEYIICSDALPCDA